MQSAPGIRMQTRGGAIRAPGHCMRAPPQASQGQFLCGPRLGVKTSRPSIARGRGGQVIEVKWRESSRCPASTEQVEVSALAMTAKAELIVEHNLIPRPVGDPVNPGPVDVEIWLVGEDGEEVPESRKVVVEVQDGKQVVDVPDFNVPSGFKPGAILVQNNGVPEVPFHLLAVNLKSESFDTLEVPCFSYIEAARPENESIRRCFFSGPSAVPCETPNGLKELRKKELMSIRGELGDGGKERQIPDRVYEWDVYHDLNQYGARRSILGGENGDHPYCRRYRTGRDLDGNYEQAFTADDGIQYYVPKDEEFCKPKAVGFFNDIMRSRRKIDEVKGDMEGFSSYEELEKVMEGEEGQIHLPRPFIYEDRELLWKNDPYFADFEFGRQRIAGPHACTIQAVKDLESLGPVDNDTINEILLDGATLQEKIDDNRIFTIDYRSEFLSIQTREKDKEKESALDKLNAEGSENFLYAPSCVLYLTDDNVMMPVAVVLATPEKQGKDALVYTPYDTPTEWALAKGHFLAADACVHQVYSHFTRCHACAEVCAVATRRKLSAWHPIFRLLIPHFKDTLRINANARQSLLSAEQVIEQGYAIGEFCMDLAGVFYGKHFRFKTEGLPKELEKRGMAEIKQEDGKEVVQHLLKDYPYAQDGMLLWNAIHNWVEKYVKYYYKNDGDVGQDLELMDWWKDIRENGHPDIVDKKIASASEMWPTEQVESRDDLVEILTSIIWSCSGLHSAINFGQYDYSAHIPGFPPAMLKQMPKRGSIPGPRNEKTFFEGMTAKNTAVRVAATVEVLSKHYDDEEYLGQKIDHWFQDPEIEKAREEFETELKQVQKKMEDKNVDPENPSRSQKISTPYTLLYPSLAPGRTTGSGVPNSISI